MKGCESHLSDEELLLAADGEGSRMVKKASAHLAGCVECRKRAEEFESAIAELALAQRDILDSQLPPIAVPRATLRARIADIAADEASTGSRSWIPTGSFAGAFSVACLMIVLTVAGIFALRRVGSPASASTPPVEPNLAILPNHDFTPGSVRAASLQEICALAQEEVVKEVSPSQRQKVLEEYGIPAAQADEYEVDFLITPGLGGDDDMRNLWPEPYHAATWNAHVKDALEQRLHEMVCSHRLDLAVAQKAIAGNWIAAYQQYVQPSGTKTGAGRDPFPTTPVISIAFAKGVEVHSPRQASHPSLFLFTL